MYAVIESGGKQHRVTEGEVLKLEKIEAGTGDKVNFDKVLMVGEGADVQIGKPYVASGQVTAEVISHGRADKVKIIKFNRRKHHKKQMGHRQWFTEVKITSISADGKAAPKAEVKAADDSDKKEAAPKKKAPAKKAAPKKTAAKKTAPKAKAKAKTDGESKD